ncbi:hypothetical protein [Planobispora rosea]|uniref:hypothetical protein n=1 Tax=Planobispora rosea TaxID=35762 RepID=UPI00114CF14A|nr:hypothetical protein [Planobispora rosea]
MIASNDRDPFAWLTIPEILADLDVPLEDWQEWEAAGQVPSGVLFPDGQVRISQLAYDRWLDSLPTEDLDPSTDPETIREAIGYALKRAGQRGLSRTELCELFGSVLTEHAVDEGLAALVRAGKCIPSTAPAAEGFVTRSVTRYRYWGPR